MDNEEYVAFARRVVRAAGRRVGAAEETGTNLSDLSSLHAAVDEALAAAVAAHRASGRSWGEIGASLGVSRQAAQQRFSG